MDILKEPTSMIPLADGGLAYMDENGTVVMYELAPSLADQGTIDDQDALANSVLGADDQTTTNVQTSLDDFVLSGAFQTQDTQDEAFNITRVKRIDADEDVDVDVEADDHIISDIEAATGPEDCVEQVTMFKCRACVFTAPEKEAIIQHFAEEHIVVQNTLPEFRILDEDLGLVPTETEAPAEEEPSERLLYLCSKCNGAFVSIELCRQHMIQEHKCISGPGKAKSGDTSVGIGNTNAGGDTIAAEQDTGAWNGVEPTGDTPKPGDRKAKTIAKPRAKTAAKTTVKAATTKDKKDTEEEKPKREGQAVRERERKIKCTVRGCPFKFSNEECLEIHKSCHIIGHNKSHNIREFQCVHCQEKFLRWRQCSSHLWRTHKVDVDMLACPVCGCYKASTTGKLEIHMRIHGDERPYRCSRCSKSFKQSAQLRNHSAVHLDKKASSNVPRWYMEQRCPVCDKTYSDTKCLKKHIQAVHSKLRPYLCSVCGHAASCRAMLLLHLRQHTGEKPYSCTHCDYRTGDHNCLRRHLMRHTGERQYQCPHCPYTAIQANSFKAHVRNRHPGLSGVFTCDKCRYQTVNSDAMQQHKNDHEKGLIPISEPANDEEEDKETYFPGNVAAAHFMFHYLGSVLKEPGQRAIHCANVMDSKTSADGTTQSITIQIPTQQSSSPDLDDDESAHCFLELKGADEEISIDTGGITIPAEPQGVNLG